MLISGFFLPLLPKGGEGRGEEADVFNLKSPHPDPLPAWAGRGNEFKLKPLPIPMKQLLRKEPLKVFAEWKAKPDKIRY